MKMWHSENGTAHIELTAEESVAVDEAMEIVEQRSKAEGGEYDKEMLEWWLCGHLREREVEGMTKMAKRPRSIRCRPFRSATATVDNR